MTNFDLVTLAQLKRGEVKLYRVRFTSADRNNTKTYVYKSTLPFEVGEKAAYRLYGVVPGDKDADFGKVVEVLEEVTTIEPGINYNWLLGRVVDYTPYSVYAEADRNAQNLLAMVRAEAEMAVFIDALSKHQLLPPGLPGTPRAKDDAPVIDDESGA